MKLFRRNVFLIKFNHSKHQKELKRKKIRIYKSLKRPKTKFTTFREEIRHFHLEQKIIQSQNIVHTKSFDAPEFLNLELNFEKTIQYLHDLRYGLEISKNEKIRINLKDLKQISMEACLMLVAEVNWAMGRNKHCKAECRRPDDSIVDAQLDQFGFHDYFNLKFSSRTHLPFFLKAKSSNKPEPEVAADLVTLFKTKQNFDDNMGRRLYEALVECMVNVNHHAYPENDKKKWWLAGAYDQQTNKIKFSFYDKGITIPTSLRGKIKSRMLKVIHADQWLTMTDSEIIQEAVDQGRSRTKLTTRGNGLPSLKVLIDAASQEGTLNIYSGNGKVHFDKDPLKNKQIKMISSIEGTLITWELV